MNRTAARHRPARAALAGLLALGSTLALSEPSAAAPAELPTPDAVAEALVAAFGPGATVDDSSLTQCMGTAPMTLAYRTDRIILRPPPTMTTATAVDRVAAALRAEMGPGTFAIGTPETIQWDAASNPAPAAPASTPRVSGPSVSGPRVSGPGVSDVDIIWRVVSVPVQSLVGEEGIPVVRLARRLRLGGTIASPEYLMGPGSGPMGVWPMGPPIPIDKPTPPRTEPGLGAGTTAVVYDTGLPPASQANIPPNVSQLTPADVEQPDRNGDGLADRYYAVHLTAIAGILQTLVPEATVRAVRITGDNGVATDFSAAKRMANTLHDANDRSAWPQVIVNSFGSPVCDGGPADPTVDMVPLGLQMVAEAVDRHQEAVVVAAAGNRGTDRRFYPAAFEAALPSVISVGALDAAGDATPDAWTDPSRSAKRASFSNYGTWVTAWAPGTGLATYQAIGLRFEPGGPLINGYAQVSGTSHATPYVAGLILEQIGRTGQAPYAAWGSVRAMGRVCSAANGYGVAVALTSMTATATTPANPFLPVAC